MRVGACGIIAAGVWQGIQDQARARIPPALGAGLEKWVGLELYGMIVGAAGKAGRRFPRSVGRGSVRIPAWARCDCNLETSGKACGRMSNFDAKAQAAANKRGSAIEASIGALRPRVQQARTRRPKCRDRIQHGRRKRTAGPRQPENLNDALEGSRRSTGRRIRWQSSLKASERSKQRRGRIRKCFERGRQYIEEPSAPKKARILVGGIQHAKRLGDFIGGA